MPNGGFGDIKQLLTIDLDIEDLLKQNLGHIMVVDQSLEILYSNRQEDAEDAISITEFTQMYQRRINAQVKKVLATGKSSKHAVRTQEGELFEVQIYPLKQDLFLLIFNNLTPYTAQIEETELGDVKYQILVDNSLVAIAEFDMSKAIEYLKTHELQLDSTEQLIEIYNCIRVMYYNQAYQDIYNIRADTPMQGGEHIFARDPTQKEIFAEFIEKWYSGAEKILMESEILTADGEKKSIVARYSLIPEHGMKYLLVSMQDITPLKMYQRQLEQKKEQLYQSMKMWGVGQTISTITHDFNSYLAMLQSQLDLFEEGFNPEEMLQDMRSTIKSATQLSRNVLNYTRKHRMTQEVGYIALDPTLVELIDRLEIVINPKTKILTILGSENAKLEISTGELEQLLLNLLMNANEAMPDGGEITIQTNQQVVGSRSVLQLRVSDTGEGMEQHVIKSLFEPFFTTKEDTGTGLGMTIIRDIVSNNSGTISVESSIGQGTTFVIDFPLDQGL